MAKEGGFISVMKHHQYKFGGKDAYGFHNEGVNVSLKDIENSKQDKYDDAHNVDGHDENEDASDKKADKKLQKKFELKFNKELGENNIVVAAATKNFDRLQDAVNDRLNTKISDILDQQRNYIAATLLTPAQETNNE